MSAALPPAMEAVRQAVLVPPPAYVQPLTTAGDAGEVDAVLQRLAQHVAVASREARGHGALLRSATNFMVASLEAGSLDVTQAQAQALVESCEDALKQGEAAIASTRASISRMHRVLRGRRELPHARRLLATYEDSMILVHDALVYAWQRTVVLRAELDPDARETAWTPGDGESVAGYLAHLDALDA